MTSGAANPSPKLMQLGQTQPVGILNNQRVGVGNVQAGLNDGGTDQNLNFAICHGLHHVSQCVL